MTSGPLGVLREHRATCGIQGCAWCVELDGVIQQVAALVEAARNADWALRGMLLQQMGDAAETHIRDPLPDSALGILRTALRPFAQEGE